MTSADSAASRQAFLHSELEELSRKLERKDSSERVRVPPPDHDGLVTALRAFRAVSSNKNPRRSSSLVSRPSGRHATRSSLLPSRNGNTSTDRNSTAGGSKTESSERLASGNRRSRSIGANRAKARAKTRTIRRASADRSSSATTRQKLSPKRYAHRESSQRDIPEFSSQSPLPKRSVSLSSSATKTSIPRRTQSLTSASTPKPSLPRPPTRRSSRNRTTTTSFESCSSSRDQQERPMRSSVSSVSSSSSNGYSAGRRRSSASVSSVQSVQSCLTSSSLTNKNKTHQRMRRRRSRIEIHNALQSMIQQYGDAIEVEQEPPEGQGVASERVVDVVNDDDDDDPTHHACHLRQCESEFFLQPPTSPDNGLSSPSEIYLAGDKHARTDYSFLGTKGKKLSRTVLTRLLRKSKNMLEAVASLKLPLDEGNRDEPEPTTTVVHGSSDDASDQNTSPETREGKASLMVDGILSLPFSTVDAATMTDGVPSHANTNAIDDAIELLEECEEMMSMTSFSFEETENDPVDDENDEIHMSMGILSDEATGNLCEYYGGRNSTRSNTGSECGTESPPEDKDPAPVDVPTVSTPNQVAGRCRGIVPMDRIPPREDGGEEEEETQATRSSPRQQEEEEVCLQIDFSRLSASGSGETFVRDLAAAGATTNAQQ
ncbi:unnamed protein product [Pseudo-nitzschia multistriata]|uniref:Uncharacterized protein n=1 Tax=Pseudo-nitzschia multistriata TaxID=183589 RepID=A0A448YZD7_9STRA|nr:unnamed protein product [Pseudo-nitzschia multistriata]